MEGIVKKIVFCAGCLLILSSAAISQTLNDAIRLTRSERFIDATSTYKALLQKSPSEGDIYYFFGNNYLQRYFSDTATISFHDMADSATAVFQKGVQMEPTNPLNYVGLGEIALILKKMAEAQQYYNKAISLLPSKTNKTSTLTTEKHAEVLIRMASGFVKAGINDTTQVFAWLRTAEKLDNKNYDLYIVKGDAYIFMLNDGSRAITSYNMAQYFNPKSPLAKLRVGQLWMRARNYKDALNYYYEVIKIDSTFAPAYRELGFLLSKAGRNDEAKRNFVKFIKLSVGNITARIQYVNTLLDLEDYAEAITQLNEILKTDSTNNDLNRALGYSYFETGQYDKSLLHMKKFLSRSKPEKIRASDYVYYGRAMAKSKMDSLAALTLLKGYSMDTTKPELLSEAAMSYNRMKKYDKAIELYKKKISNKLANPIDYYNLGKDYYNLQDWGKVDTTLSIVNSLQADFIPGYLWRARALANLDPDTKTGLAKPVFETMVEKALPDSAKYSKELVEAYYYLSYYYLVQYNVSKSNDNGQKSLDYCQKILAIDPTNDKAKEIIKVLSPKIKH